MRKSTYESRMKLYMVLTIMIGMFITLLTGFMLLQDNRPNAVSAMNLPNIEEVDLPELSDVRPFTKLLILSKAEKIKNICVKTIQPDDYDGTMVIATATEVITMQTVDGVKHFTNHLIG